MKLAAVIALLCAALPVWAVPVSVTIVGPDDQPLPGATLSSFETPFIYDEPGAMRQQTGVGGIFAWEWDGDFADPRPIGQKPFLRVRAQAPGMATQFGVIRQGQTTIQLQPTREWGGVVLDKNQKPVAGVPLKLGVVTPFAVPAKPTDEGYGASIAIEDKIAVTDANGRWSLSGLPARGRTRITLDDPRFVKASFDLTIGQGEAAPIYVKPGGSVTGVLLSPNGAPLAGETVRAGFGTNVQTKTDANGRFTIAGLAPGEVNLYGGVMPFMAQKQRELPSYLFGASKSAQIVAGETTDAGEIRAQKGVLIKARVIGADTRNPLTNARFRVGHNDAVSVVDAQGHLQSRVMPSKRGATFDRPKIENEGYVDFDLSPLLLDTQEEVLDLGTIEMKRGNAITGQIRMEGDNRDEARRLPGLSFSREGKYEFIRPKDDGTFASPPLSAGSYQVNLNGANNDWQIVSPRRVTVPEFGVPGAPVEIVVKRLTPFLPLIKEARGRLLDAQGRGVPGATISARLMVEGGGSYANATAVSDARGEFRFEINFDIVGIEWQSTEHPKYLIAGPAQIEVRQGIATISGLVARARGAVFAGRVLGVDGKPAAGAWVAVAEARDYPPVQTKSDGSFELVDVPLEKFTLLAAGGRDWVRVAAQSEAPGVTLRLEGQDPFANDKRRAEQMILGMQGGVDWNRLASAWEILGSERVEKFIGRNGPPKPEIVALFAGELARRDPAQFERRAPELLAKLDGEARQSLEVQLNLARAASDDADARAKAGAWLDEQQAVKRDINPNSVLRLLQMAAVAQKLKRDDAAQWLDYAAALATQLKGDPEKSAFQWSRALGALNYDSIAAFTEGWKVPAEFQIWIYTAPVLARSGDLPGARRALARLETLVAAPEMVEVAEQAAKTRRFSPARSLGSVRNAVARALAPSDPVAAFAMVQKIDDIFERARAMTAVADGAQKAGDALIAEKALRETMKARVGNVEYFALAASVGARVSPQLGEELFALAKDKALPKSERNGFSPPSIGMWAFYHAPFDPAQSRVLIEREWDWRLPAAAQSKNDSFSSDARALSDLVKGMTAVDLQRAGEMQTAADAIETRSNNRTTSQFDIAVAMLATPEQRARLGLAGEF